MTNITNNVLDTIQASGADVVLADHKLQINGAPEMDFRTIENSDGLLVSLTEGLQSITITPTAADSFEYSFTVTQYDKAKKTFIKETIAYTSLSTGDTATTICTALKAVIALSKLQIATSGTSTLILLAKAGFPTFSVKLNSLKLSQAASMATASVASCTTADPTVITTSAPHGFVVGQTVVLSGSSDDTKLDNGTYLVSKTATTTTLQLMTSNGFDDIAATGTVTATLTLVAQQSRGKGSDLIAEGVADAVTGESYASLSVDFLRTGSGQSAGAVSSQRNKHTTYFIEPSGDITVGTDFNDLFVKIDKVLGADNGAGVTDHEAVAIVG